MTFLEEYPTVEERVRYILESVPDYRDNDKKLWLAYMNLVMDLRSRLNDSSNPYEELK